MKHKKHHKRAHHKKTHNKKIHHVKKIKHHIKKKPCCKIKILPIVVILVLIGICVALVINFGQGDSPVGEKSKELPVADSKGITMKSKYNLIGGTETDITVGVLNLKSESMFVALDVKLKSGDGYEFFYTKNPCDYKLDSGKLTVFPIRIKVPDVKSSDILEVSVVTGKVDNNGNCVDNKIESVYATKQIQLEVN